MERIIKLNECGHGCKCSDNNNKEATVNNRTLIRFCLGLIFLIIAVFIKANELIRLLLFVTAYLLFGADILVNALRNIIKGQVFDENFLMSISTIGAFVIGEYPEAVAVMLFFQIGEYFQGLAVTKSKKSIKDLMDIVPEIANVIEGGNIIQKKPEDVSPGDIELVKPGEKIPLDGVVISGSSYVDMSSLTGESVPVRYSVGDEVLNGALNQSGVLKIKVSKPYSQSTVSKILELMENAGDKKSKPEKFITKFAKIYTPVVVMLAVLLVAVPMLFIKNAVFSVWLLRALVFLVASCPCALVVSIPLTFVSGIGIASSKGILVKGSSFLQALTETQTVVFDKTGTLTKGLFEVTSIHSKTMPENELLETAYSLEQYSNHPVAKSIVEAYKKTGNMKEIELEFFEELKGHGLKAKNKNGEVLLAGNNKLMREENISFEPFEGIGTVVYIAVNGKYEGSIAVSDSIREDSRQAISDLKKAGIKNTVMLTGDRKHNALDTGNILGIDTIYYELLPYQKVLKIEELYEKSKGIVFVGDGINDAPVLKRADVGIAMGGIGSDAAIEASDIVIMSDEPSKVAEAIKISKNTLKTAKQNIVFALFIKLLVLIMAVFGITTMWMAVFADVGVTLITVLYSTREMAFLNRH